jgi:hypothetical protein
LKVDDSDWNLKLDRAEARARELGRVDPTIRVNADVADALAKIEAVNAAADSAGGGTKSAGGAGYGALVAGAIAVAIPLAQSLTGYVVGVSGALAGMGAAGVLAVLGIKNAMAEGTSVGVTYSAGLQALKGDLDQLEQTAASGVLSAFQTAVAQINQAMPGLNGEIGQFSNQLGTVGGSVLQGVLNGFRILNPLFMQAGQYVESLAAAFDSWTSNGGLQSFASYAQQTFPKVADALASLTNLVVALGSAFAPLGAPVFDLVTKLADSLIGVSQAIQPVIGAASSLIKLFDLLPTPIIEGLAVATGVLAIAFSTGNKKAGALKRTMGSLSNAATSFGGALPIAALVSFINQLSIMGGEAIANAVNNMDGMSAAMKQVDSAVASGDLGSATTQRNADKIQHAVTGIRSSMGGYMGFMMDASKWIHANGLDFFGGAEQAAVQGSAGKMQATLDGLKTAKEAAAQAANAAAAANANDAHSMGLASTTYMSLTSAVNAATAASKQFQAEQDLLNGVTQSVEQANITLAQSYQTSASTIAANIKAVGKAQATSLDINTQYGAQNHQMVLTEVQDAQAAAAAKVAADIKTGASQARATNDGNALLAKSKAAIIAHAVQAGLDAKAVQAIVDAELLIPPKVTSTVTVYTSAATASLNALLTLYSQLDATAAAAGSSQKQNRTALKSGGGPIYRAAGGAVETAYLASGGNPFRPQGTDTVPAMLTPGEFVVKEPSAAYNPGFIRAYNDDPQKALQSVAAPRFNVIVQSKGGVDLLQYVDVRIEQQQQTASQAAQRGFRGVNR